MNLDKLDALRTVAIPVVLIGFTVTLAFQFLRLLHRRKASRQPVKRTKGHDLPFPPGPKPLPFLGNILDLPRKHEWETFTKWGHEYGTLGAFLVTNHVN